MPRRLVGQVGNLRRIGKSACPSNIQSNSRFSIGGRLPTCPTKLVLIFILTSSANAAIWPDQLGPSHRISTAPADPTTSPEIWKEYGLQATERADYGGFRVTAYRFQDTTGAFAAAQWLQASTLGNYVISCAGKCPPIPQLKAWLAAGPPPKLSRAAYPSLDTYLPTKDLIAGSK